MKKKPLPLYLLFILVFVFTACKKPPAPDPNALDKDTSYAFGMIMASRYSLPETVFDYEAFLEGFKDFAAGAPRLEWAAAVDKVQVVVMAIQEKELAALQIQEANFLEENRQKAGVIVTPSGLQYEALEQGTGKKPGVDDTVLVHYQGSLVNGTIFDSSYDRGEPVEFPLKGIIPGWIEGLQLMNEGGSYRFYIPSGLAYGDYGTEDIPPFAPLIFDVELISIVK